MFCFLLVKVNCYAQKEVPEKVVVDFPVEFLQNAKNCDAEMTINQSRIDLWVCGHQYVISYVKWTWYSKVCSKNKSHQPANSFNAIL
jgi:hypothetical protein